MKPLISLVEKPILWNTKLTSEEVSRLSVKVGADWDKLAGLLNIPFPQSEEIRLNNSKYPSLALKAEHVFVHFNKSKDFSRYTLKTFFKELGRHDLEIELISMGNQVSHLDTIPVSMAFNKCRSRSEPGARVPIFAQLFKFKRINGNDQQTPYSFFIL